MWLFFVFVAVPIIEIALFIQIGGWLGLLPTLLIVIITAALGTHLVRSQAIATFGSLRESLETLQNPTEPLAEGAMILFAGALLLTPGFFTDAVGFLLLTPWFRGHLYNYMRSKIQVRKTQIRTEHQQSQYRYSKKDRGPIIIEGEYHEENRNSNKRDD